MVEEVLARLEIVVVLVTKKTEPNRPRDKRRAIDKKVGILTKLVYQVYKVFLIQPSSSIFPLENEVCDAGSNTFQNYDFGLEIQESTWSKGDLEGLN